MKTDIKIFFSHVFNEKFELGFKKERDGIKKAISEKQISSMVKDVSLDYGLGDEKNPEQNSLESVEKSDIVVFFIGRGYGTVREYELSLTEMEYDEAKKLNKKILVYFFPLPKKDLDKQKDLRNNFIKKIQKNMTGVNIEEKDSEGLHTKIFECKRSGEYKKISKKEMLAYQEFVAQQIANDVHQKIIDILRAFDVNNSNYKSVHALPKGYFSRNTEVDAIKEKIINDDNRIISIYGMSGLGKTTISCAIGQDDDIRKEFTGGVYYLEIGQKPNIKDKHNELLQLLENSNTYTDVLIQIKQIANNKKILLILDDVWDYQDFKNFNIIDNDSGSRILVSTRMRNLLTNVSNVSEYGLSILDEQTSFKMLEAKIGVISNELELIAVKIIEKCYGLPLSVNIVASVLNKEISMEHWKAVNDNFSRIEDDHAENPDHNTVNNAIALSFLYLSDDEQQNYLSLKILLCHSLVVNWDACKIFWNDPLGQCVNRLINSSLLLEHHYSNNIAKHLTLHDSCVEFIKNKATENSKEDYTKQFIQNYISHVKNNDSYDWSKLDPMKHRHFYLHFIDMCQLIDEPEELVEGIAKFVVFKCEHSGLSEFKKASKFLGINISNESSIIIKTKAGGCVVSYLFDLMVKDDKKEFAEQYLKGNIKDLNGAVYAKCLKILPKHYCDEILIISNFWEIHPEIISTALKTANKGVAKLASKTVLDESNFWEIYPQIINTALETANKGVAEQASERVLTEPNFWKIHHDIISTALKTANKGVAKLASKTVLDEPNFWELPHQIINTALKTANKGVAELASERVLTEPNFWELPHQIINTALKKADDEVAKQKSKKVLDEPNFWKIHSQIISTALMRAGHEVSKDKSNDVLSNVDWSEIDKNLFPTFLFRAKNPIHATPVINEWENYSVRAVIQALYCFAGQTNLDKRIHLCIDTIIKQYLYTTDGRPKARHKRTSDQNILYCGLMCLAFHSNNEWKNSNEINIKHWRSDNHRHLAYRAIQANKNNPGKIKTMCKEILSNCETEIFKQVYDPFKNSEEKNIGNHVIKSLAHPDLKEEALTAASKMMELDLTNTPDFFIEMFRGIVDSQQYPDW